MHRRGTRGETEACRLITLDLHGEAVRESMGWGYCCSQARAATLPLVVPATLGTLCDVQLAHFYSSPLA